VTGLFDVGFTLADGAKLHVTPVAGVLQVKFTALLNVPEAVTCMVKDDVPPWAEFIVNGLGAPSAKSAIFTVNGSW
jgi:hypothetical protein